MTMKKFLALALALGMLLSMVACAPETNPTNGTNPSGTNDPSDPTGSTAPVLTGESGKYTYLDWTSALSTSWNPHTYQTTDQSYPLDYTTVGFYSFIFNDALNPVEGKDPFAGYVIVPELAASEPVDVTEQMKADAKWGIPEGATSGYAYTIDLNKAATWQDGTPITADDYVESMKRLLDPRLLNYRANGYYTGSMILVGAENYALQGQSVLTDNGVTGKYVLADLVKGDDGNYLTPDGQPVYVGVNFALEQCGGNTLKQYVDAYGEAYFGMARWEELVALMNEEGLAPLNDDTLAMLTDVTTTNPAWNETDGTSLPNYLVYNAVYGEASFDDVGLFKSGDYQITIVMAKSLAGFDLLYNLTSTWLVKCDAYDACLKEETTAGGTSYTSSYNTSVETCWSYGPYIMDNYQTDKNMHFTKNTNWYGYTDGKHVYVDPVNGKTYDMFATTDINCTVVGEVATAKQMFLAGQLMQYGLQSDDYADFGKSEFAHFTPGEAVYFFILNGHLDAIKEREAASDFDQSKYDLEMLTLTSLHQAINLSYDRQAYCDEFSPAQSPAFGLVGNAYICDPDTGAKYRDSEQAKKALCNVYGVDYTKFDSLDAAIDTITGYDPETAKTFYQQAYEEGINKGYITDTNNDGKADQKIKITYALGGSTEASEKMLKILTWLGTKANEAAAGTGLEGAFEFVASAPLGDAWSDQIKAGQKDTVLGGWSGSAMDPFGLMQVYVDSSYQYDAGWFNAKNEMMTLTIDGEEITMNLVDWWQALVGYTVTVGDKTYNFGSGNATQDVRLTVMAAMEEYILKCYNYLPFTESGSYALLSQKAYYVIEDYNPVLGRGGITYLRYNYDDAEWADYVNSGKLKY